MLSDELFVKNLKESIPAVERAAEWLRRKGFWVMVPPTRIRPDVSQRREYSDNGDLYIIEAEGEKRIEVKGRPDILFHSKGAFPFSTVIVNERHKHDNAVPTPFAYFIFSSDLKGCLLVYTGQTRRYWIETARIDSRDELEKDYYECPLKWAIFRNMDIQKGGDEG